MVPNKAVKDLSVPQVNGLRFGLNVEKEHVENRLGPKMKRLGGSKARESNGPRQKQNSLNKPTRGLVFGPAKGKDVLSANGKRLRVESAGMGCPGGVFVKTREAQSLDLGGGVSMMMEERMDETLLAMTNANGGEKLRELAGEESGPLVA